MDREIKEIISRNDEIFKDHIEALSILFQLQGIPTEKMKEEIEQIILYTDGSFTLKIIENNVND